MNCLRFGEADGGVRVVNWLKPQSPLLPYTYTYGCGIIWVPHTWFSQRTAYYTFILCIPLFIYICQHQVTTETGIVIDMLIKPRLLACWACQAFNRAQAYRPDPPIRLAGDLPTYNNIGSFRFLFDSKHYRIGLKRAMFDATWWNFRYVGIKVNNILLLDFVSDFAHMVAQNYPTVK